MSHNGNRPIFLLSIDGGGIFGLLALKVLEYLEEKSKRPISSLFDCITGVSAGGLIALGLVTPHSSRPGPAYSARQLSTFFEKNAKKVFQKTAAQHIAHKIPLIGTLNHLLFSKYCSKGAHALYADLLGQNCMSQALTHTIIPAYNIHGADKKGPRLKVFDSLNIAKKNTSPSTMQDFLMYEVALATSAVPTYFPPHRMHTVDAESQKIISNYHLIDGGVAINNPTVLAYSDLRARYPKSPIYALSLGVGSSPEIYTSMLNNPSPGALAWLGKISHMIVLPQLSVYKKLLTNLQKEAPKSGSYWRIQPKDHEKLSKFDDVSADHLRHIAQTGADMLQHNGHILDALMEYFQKSSP